MIGLSLGQRCMNFKVIQFPKVFVISEKGKGKLIVLKFIHLWPDDNPIMTLLFVVVVALRFINIARSYRIYTNITSLYKPYLPVQVTHHDEIRLTYCPHAHMQDQLVMISS
jgi:hypothetical protein